MELNLKLQSHHNLEGRFEVQTELEKELIIMQAIQYQIEKIDKLKFENNKLKDDIKLLVHDFKKLYTTTEIAKELNLKSAIEAKEIKYYKNLISKLKKYILEG